RRLRYTEHLVFALHLHAFWFLLLLLLLSEQAWLSGLATLAVPVYTFLALRRVYGGGWFVRLLIMALGALLYTVSISILMVMVVIWSLLF
ncbi:MAG: hypothetical protein Q8M96_21675, partial [Rubrivivax sp.]|nr:hypothetical protein [Rubrivivax sp.]